MSLSIGFIFLFSIIGSLNIFLHYFGVTYNNLYFLLLLPTIVVYLYSNNLKKFILLIKDDISKFIKSIFNNLEPLSFILISIIVVQIICLIIRLFSQFHGDALSQYFD